jgi:hypothetical protein
MMRSGLHAQDVVLPVHEHRKRAAFGEVLRHEAHGRLIGIEVGLFPEHEDAATPDNHGNDDDNDDPSFSAPSGIDAAAFGHPRLSYSSGLLVRARSNRALGANTAMFGRENRATIPTLDGALQ